MTRTRLLSLWLGVALLGGACGGGGSTPDTQPDTSVHMIDADDANIQYTGRIDFTNAKLPKFALGATYVTARFKGVGVTALIKDEHRYGMWRNYYDAVIDGAIVSKIKINDDVAMYSYPIVSDLPYGEHEITIVKRTEPNVETPTSVTRTRLETLVTLREENLLLDLTTGSFLTRVAKWMLLAEQDGCRGGLLRWFHLHSPICYVRPGQPSSPS